MKPLFDNKIFDIDEKRPSRTRLFFRRNDVARTVPFRNARKFAVVWDRMRVSVSSRMDRMYALKSGASLKGRRRCTSWTFREEGFPRSFYIGLRSVKNAAARKPLLPLTEKQARYKLK